MREVADGVFQLKGFPKNAINVYLANGVLFDAATRQGERRVLRQLRGQAVTEHALTHAHADHQGASHRVCTELGIPLAVGESDVPAMEGGPEYISSLQHPGRFNRMQKRVWAGAAHPVDRVLRDGDDVGGFAVLDVPGHSVGHVAYWRERDRVLILGDVVNTMNLRTTRPGIQEPPEVFTPDPASTRRAIRRLAALEPHVVLAGHGPPVTDPAALPAFAATLPTP